MTTTKIFCVTTLMPFTISPPYAILSLQESRLMVLLASSSGTALLKSNRDVRPTVTEDPPLSYTGHALATEHHDVIRAVCGDEQYMGLPAGCEVVAHSVRYLLEADPTLTPSTPRSIFHDQGTPYIFGLTGCSRKSIAISLII